MNSVVIVTLGICSILIVSSQVAAQQMVNAQAQKCQKNEGANEADLQEMMQGKLPSTNAAKCMHACMMEELGVLKDGKQSPEAAIALARRLSNNNPTVVKVTTDVTRSCASVTDLNRCEMAFKMIQCSMEASKKYAPSPNQ